jgi:hypothetical protein
VDTAVICLILSTVLFSGKIKFYFKNTSLPKKSEIAAENQNGDKSAIFTEKTTETEQTLNYFWK